MAKESVLREHFLLGVGYKRDVTGGTAARALGCSWLTMDKDYEVRDSDRGHGLH